MKQLLFALMAVFMTISCKKDLPAFSPTGYWRGNIHISNAALLNRPDGTCRVYIDIKLNDTSDAGKGDGTYQVTGNGYRAEIFSDTAVVLVMISEKTGPGKMSGRMLIQRYSYNFELHKQP